MKNLTFLIVLFICLFSVSCSDSGNGTARLQVSLVDGPGDYEKVNIDIQDFLINYSSDDTGWQALNLISPGVFNLLELTGGVDLLLVDEELPVGELNQIRLVLGDNNSVVIDGEEIPLDTPSAQQSGLKLNVNSVLEEGIIYRIVLDFDADESIVKAGNSGKYNLKPVVRAMTEAQSGAITGKVVPFDVQVMVYAHQGVDSDTIRTYADDIGKFLIHGVPAGTYEVEVEPEEDSGYQDVSIDDVEVVTGEITDVGEVDIQ